MKISILLLSLLFSVVLIAQNNQSINFQSVLRNEEGKILANENVNLKVVLSPVGEQEEILFEEMHIVTTNDFGIISIAIGSVDNEKFMLLDWGNGPFIVQLWVNGTFMGVSPLGSVPYAFYADKVRNDSVIDDDAFPDNELIDSVRFDANKGLLKFYEGGNTTSDSVYLWSDDDNSGNMALDTLFIGVDTMTQYPLTLPNYKNLGDGLALDKPSLKVVNNGGLKLEVENIKGGNMIFQIEGRNYTLDCTTGSGQEGKASVDLNEGTSSTNPKTNYIYVCPEEGKAKLCASSELPSGAFAWVGKVTVPDAETFDVSGPYLFQRFTEAYSNGQRGVLSHQREKLRALGAVYISGIKPEVKLQSNSNALDNVHLTVTEGQVYQLHRQTFPAFDSGPYYYGNGEHKFEKILDLNEALTTSLGDDMEGGMFNLVFWGAVNYSKEDCKIFVNLPSGVDNRSQHVLSDLNKRADYSVPNEFRSVAFLIARVAFIHLKDNGGTWFEMGTFNLAGIPVGVRAGGTTVAPGNSEFSDKNFRFYNFDDETKEVAVDLSMVSTNAQRTVSMPDMDITLGDMSFIQNNSGNTKISTSNTEEVSIQVNGTSSLHIGSAGNIGIGTSTPSVSAVIDMGQQNGGVILPRLSMNQRDALSPEPGMIIYNSNSQKFQGYAVSSEVLASSCEATTGLVTLRSDHSGERASNRFEQVFQSSTTGQLTKVELDISELNQPSTLMFKLREGSDPQNEVVYAQIVKVSTVGKLVIILPAGLMVTMNAEYNFSIEYNSGEMVLNTASDICVSGACYHAGGIASYDLWFKIYTGNSGWTDLH